MSRSPRRGPRDSRVPLPAGHRADRDRRRSGRQWRRQAAGGGQAQGCLPAACVRWLCRERGRSAQGLGRAKGVSGGPDKGFHQLSDDMISIRGTAAIAAEEELPPEHAQPAMSPEACRSTSLNGWSRGYRLSSCSIAAGLSQESRGIIKLSLPCLIGWQLPVRGDMHPLSPAASDQRGSTWAETGSKSIWIFSPSR